MDVMQHFETMGQQFAIKPFTKDYQTAARELILVGLEERWGWRDETANPDLDDIGDSWRHGQFVTLWLDESLVGTGGVSPEGEGTWRIARMSVKRELRGAGLGEAILDALIAYAATAGARRIVLETTSAWEDAVRFYRNCGFGIVGEDGENTHFELDLDKHRRPW